MSLLSIITLLVTLTPPTHPKEVLKTYSVKKINPAIQLSGKGDDPLWKKAEVLSDFSYPWDKEIPRPTKFRALHNDEWVYCLFEVSDADVNIRQTTNHKSEVASSSRAEIFFKIDDRLEPYYCLEIDPLGRVFDYEGHYYRKFDSNWTWPAKHLVVKTEKTEDGYTIELALSKASLKKLRLLKDNQLQAGLYRANCSFNASGDPHFKWISWVNPESKTPDFHIPSSFGIFTLKD
jgi:hypothetical protein